METNVRPAHRTDISALAAVLARAFYDDPIFEWMLPQESSRLRRSTRMFATITRHDQLADGGVEVAVDAGGRVVGATLWSPPGRWQTSGLTQLRMLPGLARAFGTGLPRAGKAIETMKKHHPTEPHWYLATIGTDPDVRGGGYGHALLTSRLDRCDDEGVPAYLESSKPENVPYYQRFGFEVTGEFTVGADGPPAVPMWRTPR